jgi:nitrogen regulatory protein PII
MKRIEVTVRRQLLDSIQDALVQAECAEITVSEVRSLRRQSTRDDVGRGPEPTEISVPKVRIEVVVGEPDVAHVLEAILDVVPTDPQGDDKIFVSNLSLLIVR